MRQSTEGESVRVFMSLCSHSQGLWLHEFVPPWLSLFSPSLTILTLTDCHIPEFKSTPTASPHIQTLQITRLTDSIPPESANVGILKHAVTAQLLALPNVQNVTIDWQQRALVENGGVPVSDIVRPPLHATLRCVDIPNWVLRDQDMEIFLAMPALHEIGYQYSALSTDFSERACEWTQVTLSDLRSGDLPLMPLRQVQRLCLRSRPLEQPPAAVTRPAAQRAAAMQVWLQWAYNTPPALAAGAQILNNIPEVIVIPPLGWKWPNDSGTDTDTAARMGVQPAAHTGAQTEVIFTCGREWGGTDSLALHQTTLLAIWPAIARGLENTPAHTLTVQLRNIDTCTAALVSALTQRLTTTSPPSVLSRLRLEMCHTWVSAFDKFTDGLPERLLHADVTHGLPLVFTLCPDSTIYDVRLALKNAPRGHGGTRAPRVTLQLLPRVIPESSRGIEVIYGALAAEAGVEFECVCVGEEGGDGQDGVWGGQWWGWAQESLSYVYKLFGY